MQLLIGDSLAMAGRKLMEYDHREKVIIFFNTNEERISALQRWFPRVYECLSVKHPLFFENPAEFPPAVMNIVNQQLCQMIPSGAFRELQFH